MSTQSTIVPGVMRLVGAGIAAVLAEAASDALAAGAEAASDGELVALEPLHAARSPAAIARARNRELASFTMSSPPRACRR